jgi:hypothetical protein
MKFTHLILLFIICLPGKGIAQKYLFDADSCSAAGFPDIKGRVYHRGYGETILKKEQLEIWEDNKQVDFSLTPVSNKDRVFRNKKILLLIENHYKPKGIAERDFFANVINSGVEGAIEPGDQFMIATFDWHRNGKYIFPQLNNFTDDIAVLRNALTGLKAPADLHNEQNGADINSSLLEAIKYLTPASDSMPAAIFLFSDELDNLDSKITTLDIRNRSYESKIPIYAISYQMYSRYSPIIRDQICVATFGKYFISPVNDIRASANKLKEFLDSMMEDYKGTTFSFSFTSKQEKNGQKLNLKFNIKNTALADAETVTVPALTFSEKISRNGTAVILGGAGILLAIALGIYYFLKSKRKQTAQQQQLKAELSRQSDIMEKERAATQNQIQAMQQQQAEKEKERIREEQHKREADRLTNLMLARGVFPTLHYTYKEKSGKIDISQPVFTIGRDTTNSFYIQQDTISRKHATILFDESGSYTITDNNSSNGTFVNGEKIRQAVLRNDDVIQIGDINMIFQN